MAHRQHRSARQWQQLVDRQARSSQSAREVCDDHDIGYASFIQWRSRLSDNAPSTYLSVGRVPKFVELTSTLDERRHHEPDQLDVDTPILIELDPGGGLQLRISRGA